LIGYLVTFVPLHNGILLIVKVLFIVKKYFIYFEYSLFVLQLVYILVRL